MLKCFFYKNCTIGEDPFHNTLDFFGKGCIAVWLEMQDPERFK